MAPVMVTGGAATSATAQERPPQATSLVAFFSRTGNTRVIAHQIRRATSSDIFEIIPARDYPEDYEQTVAQARQETLDGFRPELRSQIDPASRYEKIYLGFPIWGTTAPPPIRSFLATHDLRGKTIVPFVTHGGYGLGNSVSVLADHAAEARIVDGFTMEGEQERRVMEKVTAWLGDRK